jgi:UDP-2,3-diacylglucosamine pyrophosphatase LpxH
VTPAPKPQHHRCLFLSDLHLGALGCRTDLILGFLQAHHAETYYLVGDILDLWHPLLPHWSDGAQQVIEHLRARKAAGAQFVYLTGNHDPSPDCVPERHRLPVAACDEAVHIAADGRRYLVTHGDRCDERMLRAHLLTRIGSQLDHMLRVLDRCLIRLRRRTRPDHRSAVEFILSSVNAVQYLGRGHERRLVNLARERGLDGVICGHFHISALHEDHGVVYANCGDWVDSFTALAEGQDGGLTLLGGRATIAQVPAPLPVGPMVQA